MARCRLPRPYPPGPLVCTSQTHSTWVIFIDAGAGVIYILLCIGPNCQVARWESAPDVLHPCLYLNAPTPQKNDLLFYFRASIKE